MRWKSNKTKPTKNGLMDSIIYLDSTGQPHYNVKLTCWGKDARIDGKTWNEIKDNVWAWEYHLLRRTDSLEKTLILGKIEGGRRRG